jgi:APA family basic amino acid/polyamine antiporter
MILRVKDKDRARPFRTPLLFVVAPLAILGCVVLFMSLNIESQLVFAVWAVVGLIFYFLYGRRNSNLARGIIDVVDDPAMQPETARDL